MAPTGSMIGFIVLVALVIIGVILYAYLTVMSQSKTGEKAKELDAQKHVSRYKRVPTLQEFVKTVRGGQQPEILLPLTDLAQAKELLAGLMHSAEGGTAKIDEHLLAECPKCGQRTAGWKLDGGLGEICATPDCGSREMLLRWVKTDETEQVPPPAGE